MELVFLGTCGGRYAMAHQTRNTGGIVVKTHETQLHIDPGPGALTYSQKYIDPEESEGLLISHAHLDHCSDAEPIIEMITEGHQNECRLYANETSLNGFGDIEKTVSQYHQNLCNKVSVIGENAKTEFKDITIESQEMFHSDPKTVGFTLTSEDKKIGFWTDTSYSDELISLYEDVDIMVIYCTCPKDKSNKVHTSLKDVPQIMDKIDAKTCIITHFGMNFLNIDMASQKKWLEGEIDGRVVFAEDGMIFPGNKKLNHF